MEPATANPCANCERLQAQVDALRGQLEALQAVVTQLQEQLASARKNSSNSSKPPSSDIVKPPKPASPTAAKRRIGGQPGHAKHERDAFPAEQVTSFVEHPLHGCPRCGGELRLSQPVGHLVQQVDFQPPPLTVEQHTCPEYWCGHCAKAYRADLPSAIETGGLVGPRLTVLIAYLKGVCHASFSTVRKFIRDVVGVTISRGQLAKVIAKVSEALAKPYDELLGRLPDEPVVNVDETCHKDRGQLLWTW